MIFFPLVLIFPLEILRVDFWMILLYLLIYFSLVLIFLLLAKLFFSSRISGLSDFLFLLPLDRPMPQYELNVNYFFQHQKIAAVNNKYL